MKCACGGYSRIVSSENTRRRRKCGSCGKNFTTVEVHESEMKLNALRIMRAALTSECANQARAVLRVKGYLR